MSQAVVGTHTPGAQGTPERRLWCEAVCPGCSRTLRILVVPGLDVVQCCYCAHWSFTAPLDIDALGDGSRNLAPRQAGGATPGWGGAHHPGPGLFGAMMEGAEGAEGVGIASSGPLPPSAPPSPPHEGDADGGGGGAPEGEEEADGLYICRWCESGYRGVYRTDPAPPAGARRGRWCSVVHARGTALTCPKLCP